MTATFSNYLKKVAALKWNDRQLWRRRCKNNTGSADAALAEREGFALSVASVLVAPSRLGNFLSVASCSLFLPIRSAEIARSNPRSKNNTGSADAALAEREGFEPSRECFAPPTRFPVVPIRPLWHLSKKACSLFFSFVL